MSRAAARLCCGLIAATLAIWVGWSDHGPRQIPVVLHAQTPATQGQWSAVQQWPAVPVHMQLLPTGKVLFWSYEDDPRLWDPQNGTITPAAGAGFNLFCTGHTFLADGRLFVAGGHISNSVGLPNAAIYNPFTNLWTRLPNMNAGRWYPTTTTLPNGDVFVMSGAIDTTVGTNYLPQVWENANGRWRDLVDAQPWTPLYPWLHLMANGQLFNSGPQVGSRYLDPSGTGAVRFVGEAQWGYRDYGTSVLYDDGKVLIAGGGIPPTATAEIIDLNAQTPAWTYVGPMAFARRQLNSTLLPDGRVLISGGSSGGGFDDGTKPVLPVEVWDPATRQFTLLASGTQYRGYHSTATLLPDGRVLSAGGDGTPNAEVFSPPYLFNGTRPTVTSAPQSVSYGQSFFVETPDAAAVTRATWIRLTSVTHSFNLDQRINRLTFSRTTGGLNIVAPTDANLTPPGYYMLFLLNSGGVPSIARFIQISAPPPTPPAAPSALTAAAVSSTQINLAWADNATTETGFDVQRSPDGITFTTLAALPANARTYVNTGLTASTRYHYRVRATNAAGVSAWSNVANAQTLSGQGAAPTGLTATAVSSTQINLAWTDNSTNETGFEIQRSPDGTTFTALISVGANVVAHANTGLAASTTYHYRVRAATAGGPSAWSNVASASTRAAGAGGTPFAGEPTPVPGIIQAEDFDNGGEGIAYHDLSAPNEGGSYRTTDAVDIEPTTDGSPSYSVGWTQPGEWLTYSVNVAAAGTYTLEVRVASSGIGGTFHVEANALNVTGAMAIPNTGGWHAWQTVSKSVSLAGGVQTLRLVLDTGGPQGWVGNFNFLRLTAGATVPVAPTGLTATAVSSTQINLGWTDPATTETGFEIERSPDGTTFTPLATVAANVTTYAHTGLTAATTHHYRVRATNGTGPSAWSNIATAQTSGGAGPTAPTGLTATTVSSTQINLAWTDNATNETGFEIERSPDGTTFTPLATVAANVTTYAHTGLTAGTTHHYRVRATNGTGPSAWSNVATAQTSGGAGPTAPTGLTATTVSSTQINLAWTDNATNETGFEIERSPDGTTFTPLATVAANVTTYAHTGLTAATTYHYRVRATNGTGASAWSNVATAQTSGTVPAAPTGLTATAVSSTQINLAWTDAATTETGFEIERSPDGTTFTPLATVAANVTTYAHTGLTAATTHHYRVRATNGTGASAWSNVAMAQTSGTVPAAPTGLTATAVSSTQINLAWTDAATTETGFEIERSPDGTTFTPLATVAANVTTYAHTGLTAATTQHYRVRAINGTGASAWSNVATAQTTGTVPAAPTGLTATAVSSTQINLAWTDPATTETGFEIERSPDGTTFTPLATVAANATTYVNTGLTAATTYHYRVRATNGTGASAWSNVATAQTTGTAPAAPTGLTATAVSSTQINLAWTDTATTETGFEIERSPDGTTFTSLATVAANVTTYSHTGLTAATTQHYRVRATNGTGASAWSNVATAQTSGTVPAAPTGLTATAVSSSQINLAWTDTATNETGFEIERSPDGTTFTPLATVAANVTTYANTGLTAATTYHYRVRATNGTGPSAWSNTATAQTSGIAPAAPTGLTATAVSSTQINLAWTDTASNETGFQIERSPDGTTFTALATVAANVTTYANTGLTAATTYHYRVRATNGTGPSAWSNTATAQTTGPVPAAPTGLTATAVSSTQINLAWTDNATNETGFEIERSRNGTTNFTPVATVGPNVRTYSDTGLRQNTRYYYRVRAINAAGPSAWSNEAFQRTQ